MTPSLIDTHCHLNFPDSFPDLEGEIQEAKSAGISKMITIGCDLTSSQLSVNLAASHDELFSVVGWHPNSASTYDPSGLAKIRELACKPKVVAIGEIGLDYHWDFATRDQQFVCLRDQLQLAEEIGLPVVFHCRDAYNDLLDLLESINWNLNGMLFHCFSGDEEQAKRVCALGAYIGVDGPVTFPKSIALRELLDWFPKDRVVLETDSPYLSPHPFRGKPNRPAYLTFVNQAVARCWRISPEESAQITSNNAERFFKL